MCPFCFATAAWIAAGFASTGGVTALAVSTFRKERRSTTDDRTPDGREEKA